jgi:hypothetical protein
MRTFQSEGSSLELSVPGSKPPSMAMRVYAPLSFGSLFFSVCELSFKAARLNSTRRKVNDLTRGSAGQSRAGVGRTVNHDAPVTTAPRSLA